MKKLLRCLDSTEAVALLDFLTVKIRQCPLKREDGKAGVEQLAKWMGAVIDAHPTTYTLDGNDVILRDAMAAVDEKVNNNISFIYLNEKVNNNISFIYLFSK